jgi:hypothetical protein
MGDDVTKRPSEHGGALIVALMAMTVVMALGAALIVMTSTETLIARNFLAGREAFYAAEAIAELAVAELSSGLDWNAVLAGTQTSRFVDGAPAGPRTLPVNEPVDLTQVLKLANCDTPAACAGPPRWRLFAHGPLREVLPDAADSPLYVVALVASATSNPAAPALTVRGEAYGPRGVQRAIEQTLAAGGNGPATRAARLVP